MPARGGADGPAPAPGPQPTEPLTGSATDSGGPGPAAPGSDAPATEGMTLGAQGGPRVSDEYFEPIGIPHKWLRLDLELPQMELDLAGTLEQLRAAAAVHAVAMNRAILECLERWRDSDDPYTGGRAWGYRHDSRIPASRYRNWAAYLAEVRASNLPLVIPDIELDWHLESSVDWSDVSKRSVLLALENISRPPRGHVDETEESVFQVRLQARLPQMGHRALRLERVDPSYRYNKYLDYAAMGHNCGVKVTDRQDGQVSLETTWSPRYVQPRIVPKEAPGVIRHVRALSRPEGLDGVVPLVAAFDEWLADVSNIDRYAGLAADDEQGRKREDEGFAGDLRAWGEERDAIAAGIAILQESRTAWQERGPQKNKKAAVFEAWLATNEAMADFMREKFKNDEGQWRLFQLAFIVAHVPALASRLPEFKHHYLEKRDDTATLLYFATGGGKSEAFFGLLLFTLLLDRLRDKQTGVSALMRYPLRLLTIQQAQRCARVMAYAEMVRKRRGYGGEPLSIGFWVGNSGSPNRHRSDGVTNVPTISDVSPTPAAEAELRENDQKYSVAWRAWHKLSHCPFCGTSTALRRFPISGGVEGTLAHVCGDLKCFSNEGEFKPLPFFICDEDIYDFAPSVLLGTVDKLALIGHSPRTIRRIMGMFGMAPWRDPVTGRLVVPRHKDMEGGPASRNMEGLFPAYKQGRKYFFDPFPSLIIQDEAHLLDESLGAFAGLFESTLDAVFEHLGQSLGDLVARDPAAKRRRAKVIAASATVSEPQRQLEHLYQRQVPAVQFPHPGPTLYESFYAIPQRSDNLQRQALDDVELSSEQARLYCAFMTNGKPHTATSVAVLSSFHLSVTKLFERLNSGDEHQVGIARGLLLESLSPGPLRGLHEQALQQASPAELATAVDLHRVALTYVTNKKGGDQIMAAEAEETRKRHLNAGERLEGLDTRLITGSVEQGEVKAVVDAAQRRAKVGDIFKPLEEVLRSIIATSAISHGVDVEELNSMFFAGMPSDIAEYIQASSRVGRTHVGFVVLIPTPQRRRDRLVIEVFDIFHRFLERMVQPAAIDRWAERAVERVLPSLLQAYLVGVAPSRAVLGAPESEKHRVPNFAKISEVLKERENRQGAFTSEVNDFIELALGLTPSFRPSGWEHYRQMVAERTRDMFGQWDTKTWRNDGSLERFFQAEPDAMRKPMTSLRDVDEGGVIRSARFGTNNTPIEYREVLTVMDIIRDGVASNGDEGDDE